MAFLPGKPAMSCWGTDEPAPILVTCVAKQAQRDILGWQRHAGQSPGAQHLQQWRIHCMGCHRQLALKLITADFQTLTRSSAHAYDLVAICTWHGVHPNERKPMCAHAWPLKLLNSPLPSAQGKQSQPKQYQSHCTSMHSTQVLLGNLLATAG